MSALDEPSTVNAWIRENQGPIHLRQSDRKPRMDARGAHGIVVAVAVGGAVLIWSWVLARLIWGFFL
jgi:hypothetical protein